MTAESRKQIVQAWTGPARCGFSGAGAMGPDIQYGGGIPEYLSGYIHTADIKKVSVFAIMSAAQRVEARAEKIIAQ